MVRAATAFQQALDGSAVVRRVQTIGQEKDLERRARAIDHASLGLACGEAAAVLSLALRRSRAGLRLPFRRFIRNAPSRTPET